MSKQNTPDKEIDVKPMVVKVKYLYVVRVELSRPYHIGRRLVSRIAEVVHSPSNANLTMVCGVPVLEIALPYSGVRRIPEPVFWDCGNGIAIPDEENLNAWAFHIQRGVDVDADDPCIAYWTESPEGGVILATLKESGEVRYL